MKALGARFRNILLAATAQTGKQVVVLIEEYDVQCMILSVTKSCDNDDYTDENVRIFDFEL